MKTIPNLWPPWLTAVDEPSDRIDDPEPYDKPPYDPQHEQRHTIAYAHGYCGFSASSASSPLAWMASSRGSNASPSVFAVPGITIWARNAWSNVSTLESTA